MNPVYVEEGSSVLHGCAGVEETELGTNPLAFTHSERIAYLGEFLTIQTVAPFCDGLYLVGDAFAMNLHAEPYILGSDAGRRNIIYGILHGVRLRLLAGLDGHLLHHLLSLSLLSLLAGYILQYNTLFLGINKLECRIVHALHDHAGAFAQYLIIFFVSLGAVRNELHLGSSSKVLCRELLEQEVGQIIQVLYIFCLLHTIETQLGVLGITEVPVLTVRTIPLPLQT